MMNLKPRDILLMLFRASGNTISGKTKIQKECYLLSIRLQKDFNFRAYYYGPYSSTVDDSLSELVGVGFVEEKKLPWGVDGFGFEAVKYEYLLTEDGKIVADLLKRTDIKSYKEIEGFVKTLKDLGDPDYMILSVASKAYFILDKEDKVMTLGEIKQKAKKFNWNLTTSDIDKAVEILKKLKMVKK
jgi:uncharacterized protein YwgA